MLTSFGEDFEYHSHITRSVFDIGLRAVITSLTRQDDVLPVLAANALRPALQAAPNADDGWQVCLDFIKAISPQIISGPESYARDETNKTRNSFRKDVERQTASAMLFYGTGPSYKTLSAATSYGMLWANERARYQHLDLRNRIVGTFACRNTFNIEMYGDYANEIVHPALVLNSSIDAVLINHDLQENPDYEYECLSRSFLISPSNEGDDRLLICEKQGVKNQLHRSSDIPEGISDYEEVGEIRLQTDGLVTVESSEHYRRVIHNLLAV